MASIFSKIIQGEIPSYKIAETADFYAFLDIRPLSKGHTLVVPKREEDYFFDLTDSEVSGIMVFAKKVARAIEKVVPCKRVGVIVFGLEVPHAHVHLIPINKSEDMNIKKKPLDLPAEEMTSIAASIRAAYDTI